MVPASAGSASCLKPRITRTRRPIAARSAVSQLRVGHAASRCPASSNGLWPPPSGVLGQEIEEARFAEKLLNARGSADDPQRTVRARGQVVPLKQLAHAA